MGGGNDGALFLGSVQRALQGSGDGPRLEDRPAHIVGQAFARLERRGFGLAGKKGIRQHRNRQRQAAEFK